MIPNSDFKAHNYSTFNISETIQDRHVVTAENKRLIESDMWPIDYAIAADLD